MENMEIDNIDHAASSYSTDYPSMPAPVAHGLPNVFEGFVPAPDLFGPSFQMRAQVNDSNSYSYDLEGENEVQDAEDDEEEDYEELDPDLIQSIELPEYPSPWSGEGSEAATPGSYGDDDEDGGDAEEASEGLAPGEAEALDSSPWVVPVAGGVPRRSRKRPRAKNRTGQRGGWSRGLKVGPRAPLEPSSDFTQKYQEALRAYSLENDLDKAHELVVEAIGINPEVFNAHILLSHIWEDRGDTANAVQALWAGAHCFPRDPFVWHKVIEACLERATYARAIALNQARYAIKALLKLNPADCEALFQLAAVEREAGRPKKTLDNLDKILLEMPHNTDALKLYAEACVTMQKVEVAINRYKEAIMHYRLNGLRDDDTLEWTDVSQYVELLTSRGGNRDVVLQFSINTLKKLSRWLLGRSSETHWDTQQDDDAEFDMDDMPRRITVPAFEPARFSPDQYGIGLPMQLRAQLGILRLKQGFSREEAFSHFAWLEPDDVSEEASVHQFPDEFFAVAQALNEAMEYQEASRYFDALLRVDSDKDIDFWLGIGTCSYMLDDKDRALQHFQAAVALDEDSVIAKTYICKILAEQGNKLLAIKYGCEAVEAAHAMVPMSLTGIRKYERSDNRVNREAAEVALRSALSLTGPAPPKKRQGRIHDNGRTLNALELIKPGGALDPRKKQPKRIPRPPTPVEDKPQRVDDVMAIYSTLLANNEAMQTGDSVATRIWMSCAKTLINDFRSNEVFYTNRRSAQVQDGNDGSASNTPIPHDVDSPMPSIERPNDTLAHLAEYRDIPMSTWLDIFLEYALLLSQLAVTASSSAQRDSYNTITSAATCNIWSTHPPTLLLINLIHLVCALNLHDQIALFGTILPWFATAYPFTTSAYRLFNAISALFPYPNHPQGKAGQSETSYLAKSSKANRFLFRHLTAVDRWLVDSYTDPTTGATVPQFMRHAPDDGLTFYTAPPNRGTSSQRVPLRTHEMDPTLLTVYGQLHYAKGQYLTALPWFHRARALVPEEPLLALLCALCYLQQPLRPGFKTTFGGAGGGRDAAARKAYGRQKANQVDEDGGVDGDGDGKATAQQQSNVASGSNSSGDKHNWILQGVAMFEEYAALRMKQAQGKAASENLEQQHQEKIRAAGREIAFNRARVWATLGLGELAVDGFEGLLLQATFRTVVKSESDDDAMDVDDGQAGQEKWGKVGGYDDLDMQSAYALRTSYAFSGNMAMARKVTERFLVCE